MTSKLETIAIRTSTGSFMRLSKIQVRSVVRAIVTMTVDQHRRCQDRNIVPVHLDARKKAGRALQEVLGFLLAGGIYVPPDGSTALGIDFTIRPAPDEVENDDREDPE